MVPLVATNGTIGLTMVPLAYHWYHWHNGNGSFRPWVVSALSRFGRGSFWPGPFRPVVSALGRFGLFWWVVSAENQLITLLIDTVIMPR